ncbi:MAG: hypothetical protein FJ054_07665 [Cyanobacteria bacterium M_surface_10_m2_119]|nr:hypothetical protein [Cyanobacteria bacterium M_surface_10_m2_119]
MTIHRADFGSDRHLAGQQGVGWSGLVGGSGAEPVHADPVEAYFECITTCSLDDGECVTTCTEILRQHS